MRNLHKCLPWTRKNDVLQEEDPFRLRYDMVPVPTEKTYLANLPVLQSRPASRSVTTIGWKSTTTDTSKLGGCAASIFIFMASMGWHHTFWETFFLEFLHATLPSNVFFHQTVSGFYLTTIHRYENRRLSRFLAQTKREAIRRFWFELANLLDN